MAEVVLPLAIRDLKRDDLPACAWMGLPGSAVHPVNGPGPIQGFGTLIRWRPFMVAPSRLTG
jgi:hypothetical protein